MIPSLVHPGRDLDVPLGGEYLGDCPETLAIALSSSSSARTYLPWHEIERQRRLNKQKKCNKNTYRQPTKDWKQELIDKASLTHICTSECRYRPKASMVVVKEKMFTSEEMELLTMNNETLSIDGKYYVCKYCKTIIKKKRFHHVMKKVRNL